MEERIEAVEGAESSAGREAFFEWLDGVAAQNEAQNVDLSENEMLALIEEARREVAAENSKDRDWR